MEADQHPDDSDRGDEAVQWQPARGWKAKLAAWVILAAMAACIILLLAMVVTGGGAV
jgi:hypothetical protein